MEYHRTLPNKKLETIDIPTSTALKSIMLTKKKPISKGHTLIPFIQFSWNDRIRHGDRGTAKGVGAKQMYTSDKTRELHTDIVPMSISWCWYCTIVP